MPVYAYRGRLSDGTSEAGEVTGESRAAALAELHARGLLVSQLEAVDVPAAGAPRPPGARSVFQRVRAADRAAFWHQMAQTQRAGLSLHQGLDLVGDAGYGPLSSFCQRAGLAVAQGTPLSDLMAAAPETFGPFEAGLVHAGEVGGRMDTEMERLAAHFERELELRNFMRWRLLYLKLTAGAFAASLFVVAVVAPWLRDRALGGSASLIGSTLRFGLPIVLLAALVVGGRMMYAGSASAQAGVDHLKLTLPVLGPLFRKLSVARFARALGDLVGAGLPVGEAVEVAAGATGNLFLMQQFKGLPSQLRGGAPLADVLDATRQFPRQVIQMVRTGQTTGNTDEMLAKVAEYYEGEVQSATMSLAITGFVATILLAGVMVAVFAGNFYLGMFSNLLEMTE